MLKVRCDMTDATVDRGVIEERLVAYEAYAILRAVREHDDHDSLCWMLGEGTIGFYKMSDDDLLAEWEDAKEGFYGMIDVNGLPFDLLEDDPIMGTVC
jgi:hypothetical protein